MNTLQLYVLRHHLAPLDIMAVAEITPAEERKRNKQFSARNEPVTWIPEAEWQKRKPRTFDDWIMQI